MSTTFLIRASALSRTCDAVSEAMHHNACNGGASARVTRELGMVRVQLHMMLASLANFSWAADLSGAELNNVLRIVQDTRGTLANALYDSAHRLIRNGSKRDLIIRDAREIADAVEQSIRGVLMARERVGMPTHATPVGKYDAAPVHSTWTEHGAEACGSFDVNEDGSISDRAGDQMREAAPVMLEALRMAERLTDGTPWTDAQRQGIADEIRAAIARAGG